MIKSESDGKINLNTLRARPSCSSIDDLFNAEVQIDTREIYRVSEAERITCTNIRRVGDLDRIYLDISLDGQARLFVSFHVPRSQTYLWTDLNIVPSENPGLMDDLRESELGTSSAFFDECISFDRLFCDSIAYYGE